MIFTNISLLLLLHLYVSVGVNGLVSQNASPFPSSTPSSAPSSAPSAEYVDYFSHSCTFSEVSNTILEKIGLQNPYSSYNCLTSTLEKAFSQSGTCTEGDIERIITNSTSTTNCSSFEIIWNLLEQFETESDIAYTLFEDTLTNELGLLFFTDNNELFSNQTIVEENFDITNTTDFDEYGCYRQNISQVYGQVVTIISDPTCLEVRVLQANMTYSYYELTQAYNEKVVLYVVLASAVGFLLLLVFGIICLSINSGAIGK